MEFTHVANPVRVIAKVIANIDHRVDGSGLIDVEFEDGSNPMVLNDAMIARYCPSVGDYIVAPEGGDVYVSPKDVFERKYRAIELNEEFDSLALSLELSGHRTEIRTRDAHIAELEAQVGRLREMEKANSWANVNGLDARAIRHAVVMQMVPARCGSQVIDEAESAVQYILTGELLDKKEQAK
jgi:hypothetical protein